jgi:mRNA interferase MazF
MTMPGTIIDQREVVLIDFPFTDGSGSKLRPALVISNSDFNSINEDIICCMITSNPEASGNNVGIDNPDMESGKLIRPSLVKPHRIFVVEKSMVLKRVGKLTLGKAKEVVSRIEQLINCG